VATFEQQELLAHVRYLRSEAVATRVHDLERRLADALARIETLEQRRGPGRPRKEHAQQNQIAS
jgi:hypothetical protein